LIEPYILAKQQQFKLDSLFHLLSFYISLY
jgi:hypothetical protein